MTNKSSSIEFHISKKSRDRYRIDGDVVLTDLYSIRLLAQKMNKERDLITNPEAVVRASHLLASGLINEIIHYVCEKYRQDKNLQTLKEAVNYLYEKFDSQVIDATLIKFIENFPPLAVYQGKESKEDYLRGETGGIPNLQIIIEEMSCLYLANNNQAHLPFLELFDDKELRSRTEYPRIIESLSDYFKTQPTFGPKDQHLIDMLGTPARVVPHSLSGQLTYIKDHWGYLLSEDLLCRLLLAFDTIKEEEKFRAMGAGQSLVLDFKLTDTGLGPEYERFSQDADWMPKVVLIAKNVHVWLHQLSKKYDREIARLDRIPDEELDTLARFGFTGLWLIGLWERSPASERIKQWTGNPEAAASAYSLYDYTIAEGLGGEEALVNLKNRAAQRGIRLASDMVPNHTGIYSKWMIEHPDWFVQVSYPPFPGYRFSGGNLSLDERVGIHIEDGYWQRTDAAVVFKRVDHFTGDERYIYHGNDGTHMPWNDTAQLNFCLTEVREAVIQTILHVARLFSIIRFDAAMTLAKKHYQRLWFPAPGTGGDIPSRAEHGMTKEEFDHVFPNEFWREVVDRVASEVPGTLLLAEAFWLMEGYFVRTLGMHRVYNSAFMNMLKMEENEKYRLVIKNVLEFNPQILKRFVNFMNNPDEETALAQFGKDDKYFGVCLMMVTMPGLPMFGHGQIEGFSEKYGMEYKKSYWDEKVDYDLVRRHEAEIFPLMKKRYLFSEVENFLLYDFYNTGGGVNENVFAYSNRCGNDRALILYHNRFETAKGWVKTSTAISVEDGSGGRKLIQKTLAEGLALKTDDPYYYIFKDYKSGLEYIRQGKDMAENGLYTELEAFKYHIFMDFKEVYDGPKRHYRNLSSFLNGRGVASVEEAAVELHLRPIHAPFKEIVHPDMLCELAKGGNKELFCDKIRTVLSAVKGFVAGEGDVEAIAEQSKRIFQASLRLEDFAAENHFHPVGASIRILLIWQVVCGLGKVKREANYQQQSLAWIDEWMLGKIIRKVICELAKDEWVAYREEFLIKILVEHHRWFEEEIPLAQILRDPNLSDYIHLNKHEGVLYFHKESFEELIYWLFITSIVDFTASPETKEEDIPAGIASRHKIVANLLGAAKEAGYRMEKMLEIR